MKTKLNNNNNNIGSTLICFHPRWKKELLLAQLLIPDDKFILVDALSFWYIARFTLLTFCSGFCRYILKWYCRMILFSFFIMFSSGFSIRVFLASYVELGCIYFFPILWKSLYKIDFFSFNVCCNSLMEPSGSGIFMYGKKIFLILFF